MNKMRLLTLTLLAFAPMNADNFYVGGQGGITASKVAEKTDYPHEQHNLGGFGFVGGGFAGYNFDSYDSPLDVGVEAFVVGNTFNIRTKRIYRHHY